MNQHRAFDDLTIDEFQECLEAGHHEKWRGRIDEQTIIDWCRENMAVYKCPRIIEFVEALPKSGAGKIMWRELQDREAAAAHQPEAPL